MKTPAFIIIHLPHQKFTIYHQIWCFCEVNWPLKSDFAAHNLISLKNNGIHNNLPHQKFTIYHQFWCFCEVNWAIKSDFAAQTLLLSNRMVRGSSSTRWLVIRVATRRRLDASEWDSGGCQLQSPSIANVLLGHKLWQWASWWADWLYEKICVETKKARIHIYLYWF